MFTVGESEGGRDLPFRWVLFSFNEAFNEKTTNIPLWFLRPLSSDVNQAKRHPQPSMTYPSTCVKTTTTKLKVIYSIVFAFVFLV